MASSSTITISSTSSVSEKSQKRQRWYEDAHANQPSKSSTDEEFYDEKVPFHREILTSDSWFLRLGCVVFGVIGLAYYTFGIFICYHDENCNTKSTFILNVLAIIFLIVQGHFIFRNWK
uniref:Uncharacterized protein n=1 Tax=Acrobeloides nanus TaxID=290746 RepID=A0A914DEV4_9BILA